MSDTSPCVPWPIDPGCCAEWDSLTPEVQARSAELAWGTLRRLTAGRVGNCPVTVRPCLGPPCNECASWWSSIAFRPVIRDGLWFNIVCGRDPCSCARLCEIILPGPIAEVLRVSWSGEDLPLESFRIDNGNRLVRMDGECWPSCQRMDQPLGAPCTLGITYVPGVMPGLAGEYAAGVLACEYAKACTGGKCRLPASVTSIVRNGVAMDIDTGMFANGLTGIREVDAYIISVNPHALRTPPKVWSPDLEPSLHRYSQPAETAAVVRPASQLVRFTWVEADPVNRCVVVHDGVAKGWMGDYRAQLRVGPDSASELVGEFAVTAEAVGADVNLTFALDEAASALIAPGTYYWDAQQIGATTRLRGTATVGAQVTLVP